MNLKYQGSGIVRGQSNQDVEKQLFLQSGFKLLTLQAQRGPVAQLDRASAF